MVPKLQVLVYGYATGGFSSRGPLRKVAFRVVVENLPRHRTLSEFRRRCRSVGFKRR